MSVNFSNFYPVLDGFVYSSILTASKADDDVARQGYNLPLATINQLGQVHALLEQVGKLEEISGNIYVPGKMKLLMYLSAPVVSLSKAIITKMGIETSTPFKASVLWLHDNMGSVCQIASVVTNIALFHLGYQAYAVMSLSVLAIGYLERRNCLPSKVQEVYLRSAPWIRSVALIIHGDWLYKAIGAVQLFDKMSSWHSLQPMIPYDQMTHSSHLTYDAFNEILAGKGPFKVNPEHINIAPFPIVKKINFDPLIQLCDSFNWDDPENFAKLEKKLAKDARWYQYKSKEYPDIKRKSDIEVERIKIDYAKTKLKKLVFDVGNECIETGGSLNYGVIKNYLAYIAQQLPQVTKDQQRHILFQLAVEGGDYCGPGIYYQLETAATALLLQSPVQEEEGSDSERPRLPLKQRILFILQQERLNVISAFHQLTAKVDWVGNAMFGGSGDLHPLNRTIKILGDNFGLPDQGAQEDRAVASDYIDKLAYRHAFGLKSEDLWTGVTINKEPCEGYTSMRVLDAIKSQIGIPLIPATDVRQWALDWIERVPVESSKKEEFIEKLQDGKSFESDLSLRFHDRFILAMLVDMGVLSVCS